MGFLQVLFYLSVFWVADALGSTFVLPDSFAGMWVGRPQYSMLGPWADSALMGFSISKAPNGDYLFEDNLIYDSHQITGYQRFYVEGSGDTAGNLWYCGSLYNFSNSHENAGQMALDGFKAVSLSASSVSFCVDSSNPNVNMSPFKDQCSTCDCGNWTLSISEDGKVLTSQLIMGASSMHIYAQFNKMGPGPTIPENYMPGHGMAFACDFGEGGRDSSPVDRKIKDIIGANTARASDSLAADLGNVASPSNLAKKQASAPSSGCPHLNSLKKSSGKDALLNVAARGFSSKTKGLPVQQTSGDSSSFQHCYTLNNYTGFNLAWTLDNTAGVLHCEISATVPTNPEMGSNANNTWVAIGFRPLSRLYSDQLTALGTGHHFNFAMAGADIVAGSISGGVRTLYAKEYTGEPIPDKSLNISNASVEVLPATRGSMQRVVLKFTRPVVGGYLEVNYRVKASIVSSLADIIWATGADFDGSMSGCDYHYNSRGLRVVDWEQPDIAMLDTWKCI